MKCTEILKHKTKNLFYRILFDDGLNCVDNNIDKSQCKYFRNYTRYTLQVPGIRAYLNSFISKFIYQTMVLHISTVIILLYFWAIFLFGCPFPFLSVHWTFLNNMRCSYWLRTDLSSCKSLKLDEILVLFFLKFLYNLYSYKIKVLYMSEKYILSKKRI